MIKTQKKPLFNRRFITFFLLFSPPVVFFVYSTFFNTSFFFFLSLVLIVCIIVLIPMRNRLAKKLSITDIRIQDTNEKINVVEAQIDHEERALISSQEKVIDSSQLKNLTEKLSMCLTLEETTKTLSSEVNNLFGGADITIILYLFHSETGELGISATRREQMSVNIKSKKGDIFDQWVVKTLQPLLIEDIKNDYRFDVEKIPQEADSRAIRSLISAAFVSGNKALGILRVDSPKEEYFGMEDLRFLTTIADLGSVAIESAQLYQKVQQLAIRDSLTNVYLRRYLMDRMTEEITRHVRVKGRMAFLMIDLDEFKNYNDKNGHVAGDMALKLVAGILCETFSIPGTVVARYGGEEFSVLIPNCSKQQALQLAETARQKIAEEEIILRRKKTRITVSVGVAIFPNQAADKDQLIAKADAALYRAKTAGRNRVEAA